MKEVQIYVLWLRRIQYAIHLFNFYMIRIHLIYKSTSILTDIANDMYISDLIRCACHKTRRENDSRGH